MSLSNPTPRRRALPLLAALALVAVFAPAAEARVSSSFSGGVLTVTGGKDDDEITVACGADGRVDVNGANPRGGPLACSRVVEVDAVTGPGRDRVDFTGIDERFGEAEFPGFGTRTGAAAVTGEGKDRYFGSRTAFNLFDGEGGGDRAHGGNARDQLEGGAGNDRLKGRDGRDSVLGNGGADKLVGGDGADVLTGHAGADLLIGMAGSDVLGGGGGNDRLFGGPGRDRLLGGPGRDRLAGGAGRDVELEKPPSAKP